MVHGPGAYVSRRSGARPPGAGAGTSIGIHYGTFRLADDGFDEPASVLATAGEPRFLLLAAGEGQDIASAVP